MDELGLWVSPVVLVSGVGLLILVAHCEPEQDCHVAIAPRNDVIFLLSLHAMRCIQRRHREER